MQSKSNEKKVEVAGKRELNKEQVNKEQTENKNMILDKDENMENTKSEREAKGEDLKYRKPNQQCQKHQNITAAATKTKHRKKKIMEIQHQWKKKRKTTKISIKQVNYKQGISNYIRKTEKNTVV